MRLTLLNYLLLKHFFDMMTDATPKIRKKYSLKQFFFLSRKALPARQINIAKSPKAT